MNLEKEKKQLIQYGKKLLDKQLTVGTGGNLSIFNNNSQLMIITPSGIDYYSLNKEDIVVMDLDGNIIEGKRKPSSEYLMHCIVYKNRKDVNAMIHSHAVYSTTISALNMELPAIDYLVSYSGGKNVRCAQYATAGTKEIAENALKAMEGRKAVLLANHGINVVGTNIDEAFDAMEQLEFCSRIFWQAKSIGNPVILSDTEMEKNIDVIKAYGQ